jgi:tetratricopeptide (TPR) repeat protein
MAKGKKAAIQRTSGFGQKKLDVQAHSRQVVYLLEMEQFDQAHDRVQDLCEEFPDQVEFRYLQQQVALARRDDRSYNQACERLMHLQPNKAVHCLTLGANFIIGQADFYPTLGFHLLQRVLELDPKFEQASFEPIKFEGVEFEPIKFEQTKFGQPQFEPAEELKALIEEAQPLVDERFDSLKLDREEDFELMLQHEWGQLYLNWGRYEEARIYEQQVVTAKPDLIPARNNLSLIAMAQGDIPEAIASAEAVLQVEAENINALSNLVRFHRLENQIEIAQACSGKLKACTPTSGNHWHKKAEGLIYSGDYAGIVDFWQQIQTEPEIEQKLEADGLHYVAVALARSGDIQKAKQLWLKALEFQPGKKIIRDNLENCYKPSDEQHLAWPLDVFNWLPFSRYKQFVTDLNVLNRKENAANTPRKFQQKLTANPYILPWLQTSLEHGDPQSVGLNIPVLLIGDLPETRALLSTFILSQWGSFAMRNRMAKLLFQMGKLPEEIDPTRMRMWRNQAWTEIDLTQPS